MAPTLLILVSLSFAGVSGSTAPYGSSDVFNLDGAFAKAQSEWDTGRYSEAADEAARVLAAAERDLKPGDSRRLEALKRYVRYALDTGRYDEAIRACKKAMKLSSRPGYWLEVQLGEAYRMAGRLQEAAEAFKAAKAANPEAAEAYFEEGYSGLYEGNTEAALREFEAIISSRPDDPTAHHHYAVALSLAGRREEAEREFKKALLLRRKTGRLREAGMGYPHALVKMVGAALARGRFQEALGYATESHRLAPPYSIVWAGSAATIADIYMRQNLPERALNAAAAALDECERVKTCEVFGQEQLRVARSRAEIRLGRREPALADLRWALKSLQERPFRGPLQCGWTVESAKTNMEEFEQLEDWADAEKAGRLGIRLSRCAPVKKPGMHAALADLYRRCGMRAAAVAEWQAARDSYQVLYDTASVDRIDSLLKDASPWPKPGTSCALDGSRASQE